MYQHRRRGRDHFKVDHKAFLLHDLPAGACSGLNGGHIARIGEERLAAKAIAQTKLHAFQISCFQNSICRFQHRRNGIGFHNAQSINLAVNGEAKHFEVSETPFHVDGSLDKIYTIGSLADITELDAVKRTFKIHQDAHLDVLAALGTAFAIFDLRQKLVFYNKAFLNLWNLKTDFLDATPSYGEFLDKIRDSRLIPEVADFRQYKSEEEKLFGGLIESREDLLHIPDGRTFRRIVAPHPNGLIFAYEDVSDRLAATRMINELYSVQQNILDNVREAVVVFGSDQRLKYFNRSYKKLWKADDAELQGLPNLADVIEMQRPYFNHLDNWENLKQNMLGHILNICSRFRLERNDKVQIEVVPVILSDESIMITYVII